MVETQQLSKETDKPNPVSIREYHLMDRHELRAYLAPLDRQERKQLLLASVAAWEALPLADRRSIQKEYVAKLESRNHMSIGDKIELARERVYYRHLMLPEKKPIFFRKLRSNPVPLPKIFHEAKSPYLIHATI